MILPNRRLERLHFLVRLLRFPLKFLYYPREQRGRQLNTLAKTFPKILFPWRRYVTEFFAELK